MQHMSGFPSPAAAIRRAPVGAAVAAALLLTLLAPTGAAQMPAEFEVQEPYWARIGEGDIPTTDVAEPAGWSVAEYLRFSSQGGEERFPLASAAGDVVDVSCACGNATVQGMEIVIPDAEAGDHVVRLVRSFPPASGILVDFALYGGQEGLLVAYVPQGSHVDTSADMLEDPLTCTAEAPGAPCQIHQYRTDGGLHFAILPGAAPGGTGAPGGDDDDGFADDLLPIVLGALGGALLWAFLVQRGYVQRRRRQEVTTAAHKQVAAEGKEMLQARKRVLMAGLKDLEMAKMNKQVDDAAYERLKAELKKETVTVMRALEESS